MKTKPLCLALGLVLSFFLVSVRSQTTIYSENFESTSGTALPAGWFVEPGKFGESVANPLAAGLNTSLRVLSFSAATANDDTYSHVFDLSALKDSGQTLTLSFDFLSAATTNHAGLIGLRFEYGDGPAFLAGSPATQASVNVTTLFSGTGAWQHVTVNIDNYVSNASATVLRTTYIYFEQWTGDAGQVSAAPVYFDNLTITAVPEPSAFALVAALVALRFVALQRRKHGLVQA